MQTLMPDVMAGQILSYDQYLFFFFYCANKFFWASLLRIKEEGTDRVRVQNSECACSEVLKEKKSKIWKENS